MKIYQTTVGALVLGAVVAIAAPMLYSPPATAEFQPKMSGALADLQAAERKLEKASTDKGGHRKAALSHVRKAITEVKKGMRFDNRH